MFTDTIRTAHDEYEIYFLLAAYIETVQQDKRLGTTPEDVTRLPVRGLTDVVQRFESLVVALDAASRQLDDRAVSHIRDALHTFGTALDRLLLLEQKKSDLPADPGAPAGAPASAPVATAGAAEGKSRVPLDILLVEDNPTDVRMTREALDVAGVRHHMHVVGDGPDAIAYLCRCGQYDAAAQPDVVLLDLNIPRCEGYDVLHQMRSSATLRHIPVVATGALSQRALSGMQDRHPAKTDPFVTIPAGMQAFVREMKKLEARANP